jgi:hypothetical protein
LLETVSDAVKGIDADTVTAFATAKLSKSNSTDIMSIARTSARPSTSRTHEERHGSFQHHAGHGVNVSKDIQARIDNGEVDQEQLMKEAIY